MVLFAHVSAPFSDRVMRLPRLSIVSPQQVFRQAIMLRAKPGGQSRAAEAFATKLLDEMSTRYLFFGRE